jgi:hypothetical protein
MTPSEEIVETDPPRPRSGMPTRRKRAARPRSSAPSGSSRANKTRLKAARTCPESASVRVRRKLAQGAEWAAHDARAGMVVLFAVYFGSTWLMLTLIGIDALAGTSLFKLAQGWFVRIKITAIGACIIWGLLILAPAALVAKLTRRWLGACIDPWAGGLLTKQLVRPMVGALAFYGATLLGAQVWDHLPTIERGPPELVVPGPDVHGAQLAVIRLNIMALECMQDPLPAHCKRLDIQRIQARYYLKWLQEVPNIFEGRRGWG